MLLVSLDRLYILVCVCICVCVCMCVCVCVCVYVCVCKKRVVVQNKFITEDYFVQQMNITSIYIKNKV